MNEIKKLIERYYEGDTSSEEESYLCARLLIEEVPEDLQRDKEFILSLASAYKNRGCSESLDDKLQAIIGQAPLKKMSRRKIHAALYVYTSIAAIFILFFFLFPGINNNTNEFERDTFATPHEAATHLKYLFGEFSAILDDCEHEIQRTGDTFGRMENDIHKHVNTLVNYVE